MQTTIKPALILLLCLTALTGVVYPLLVTLSAQLLFPSQANGSLLFNNGQPQGSELIGQNFTRPEYFRGRPSATSSTAYNAAASGGSNIGPSNPALISAVKERIKALHATDPSRQLPIPVDLTAASASGLDPHISPAAAQFQVKRVATARQLPPAKIAELIESVTEARQFGILGEARVNVLKLNLALDNLK